MCVCQLSVLMMFAFPSYLALCNECNKLIQCRGSERGPSRDSKECNCYLFPVHKVVRCPMQSLSLPRTEQLGQSPVRGYVCKCAALQRLPNGCGHAPKSGHQTFCCGTLQRHQRQWICSLARRTQATMHTRIQDGK